VAEIREAETYHISASVNLGGPANHVWPHFSKIYPKYSNLRNGLIAGGQARWVRRESSMLTALERLKLLADLVEMAHKKSIGHEVHKSTTPAHSRIVAYFRVSG